LSRRRIALFIVLPVLVLLPAAGSQAYTTGIGDQSPAMFSSPFFQALHVKIARLIVPFDVAHDPGNLARAKQWLNAAKAQNIKPLVAFYHSEISPDHIPGVDEYREDFKAFTKLFPGVTEYQPWNEANRGNVNSGQARFHSPTANQSAAFYDVMREVCSSCTVVGLDVLDSQHISSTINYINQFKRAVKHMPDVWGLHNYTDTNRHSGATRAIAKVVPGQIWLTETGGIVKFGRSFPNKRHSGERRAAKALSYMFKLAASNHKVTRLYIFQWTGSGARERFDAGLTNKGGAKPRPGYFVVRRKLTGH
jgi:hypothetical protein